MTNEEFEQEIKRLEERIEDQINSLRIKFLESNANKKPYEVEVPEDIGDYVYINNIGNIYDLNTFTIVEYEKIYKRGLAFKSKEEAEQFDKERILINKLKNWAKEQQGDWTPDWEDFHEIKYYIICRKEQGDFDINRCRRFRPLTKLPYFKTEEIAEQFIEEFGDEIIEVLC